MDPNDRPRQRHDLLVTVWLLAAALAWDAAQLDMPMAHWFGDAGGFPWREHWLLTSVLHDAARWLAWGLATALALAVWWPVGPLRRLTPARRMQLAITPLLAVLGVCGLKAFSPTSCPWDMADFGRLAHHVPHWPWSSGADGGTGHCFPAGHAAAGFAFVGGWFVFRDIAPRVARRWLTAAVGSGFLLGLSQQVRGAHFMSHTLWSGWLCWSIALAFDTLCRHAPARPRAIA